jgi:hypothetical protein
MGNLRKVTCKLENLVDLEVKYIQATRKEVNIFVSSMMKMSRADRVHLSDD